MCGVGVIVLREHNNTPQVLIIKRGKPPEYGSWTVPGGTLQLGETIVECARREVLEETGLTISMAPLPTPQSPLRNALAVPQVCVFCEVVSKWRASIIIV